MAPRIIKTWVLKCENHTPAKFATWNDLYYDTVRVEAVGLGVGLDIMEIWNVSALTEKHPPVAQASH